MMFQSVLFEHTNFNKEGIIRGAVAIWHKCLEAYKTDKEEEDSLRISNLNSNPLNVVEPLPVVNEDCINIRFDASFDREGGRGAGAAGVIAWNMEGKPVAAVFRTFKVRSAEEAEFVAAETAIHLARTLSGCDGSILLDDTITLQGEKKASTNFHSLRGFRVIDRIKNKLESDCPGIVSCADLLTVAARDAVILVGGPYWDVPLGRKDSTTASSTLASENLPTANQGLLSLISSFVYQGLTVTDLVALAGAHTIGMARCANFRARIYGDYEQTSDKNPISETQLNNLKSICPATGGGDNNITALDYVTPNLFDNSFYHMLLRGEGVLNSDQELYSSLLGIETKKLVQKYAEDTIAFFQQFSDSMVKMGNITNSDSFVTGEVRKNCRFVNT